MKMIHSVTVLLFPAVSFILLSCSNPDVIRGRGPSAHEDRQAAGFSRIEISAPVAATISVGGSESSVKLSGYENLLQLIKTEVRDNTLHIYIPGSHSISTDEDVEAEIHVPSLNYLSLTGASDADLRGTVSGEELGVHVSGAGNLSAERINVVSLDVHMSGAGMFGITEGSAEHAVYEVSGAAKINAEDLSCRTSRVQVSGAGDVRVHAVEALDVSVNGAGNVHYRGNPKLTRQISGVGNIDRIN